MTTSRSFPDKWDSSLYDDRHSFVWKSAGDLLELLDPKPNEKILDVGCGTGHLTAKIAESGAEVTGLDSSTSMIAQARQNFPKLKFLLADVRNFMLDEPCDAVFSNAALHWVREAEAAVQCISAALRPGGRFVMEMGGKGNIARIMAGVEEVVRGAGFSGQNVWYFPSIGEYATLLEANGFEVHLAQNFARWTKLEHPERGLREWLEMFGGSYFEDVPAPARGEMEHRIEDRLRDSLWVDGQWHADYRRLRIVAQKR
jgi:trans-aconitate 2-methyltransferase